jgi:hypothetical protein
MLCVVCSNFFPQPTACQQLATLLAVPFKSGIPSAIVLNIPQMTINVTVVMIATVINSKRGLNIYMRVTNF